MDQQWGHHSQFYSDPNIGRIIQTKLMHYHLLVAFLSVLGIGYGSFQANIIQFRVDQLADVSTMDLVLPSGH